MTDVTLNEKKPKGISEEKLKTLLHESITVSGDSARAKLVELALVDPGVREAIIDYEMNWYEASAYTLSALARREDQESLNALIAAAKRGRRIAIGELKHFSQNNDVKQTIMDLARRGQKEAISVFEGFISRDKKDPELRQTAFDISNLIGNDSAIKALTIIAKKDNKAKRRVIERAREGSKEAIYNLYEWTKKGDEQARRALFGCARRGNYAAKDSASFYVASLVERKDKGALSFLIKQTTDRSARPVLNAAQNEEEINERISFAIKSLVSLAAENRMTDEIKEIVMAKLYELRGSSDPHTVESLKKHLDTERRKIGPVPRNLEPLVDDFFGVPPVRSSKPGFIQEPPHERIVTKYSTIPICAISEAKKLIKAPTDLT